MAFDPSFPEYRVARNRYKEVFQESPNLVGLALAAATSLALLNPIPLLVGLVAEAAYLLFVPDTRWYMQRLEHRFDQEVVRRREELKEKVFPMVRNAVIAEFNRLESQRAQIEQVAKNEDKWFREAMRKLDFLLEKHLMFALKEAEFGRYLLSLIDESYDSMNERERDMVAIFRNSGRRPTKRAKGRSNGDLEFEFEVADASMKLGDFDDEAIRDAVSGIQSFYDREAAKLEEEAQTEDVFANRNILEKRKDILHRRREFVVRLGTILSNLGHQMSLMRDTFGLINDEIRARSPEQIVRDIDEVVTSATSLTVAIDELTPMEDVVARVSTGA